MDNKISPEMAERMEKLVEKLDNPEVLRLQVESLESAMRMTKDNFDMLDRTLSITESLHASETKKIDIFLDVIKYLLPIFATALIAGMTVDIPNINPLLLTVIGIIGFIILIIALFMLLSQRNKISDRHIEQHNQLNKVFSDWQKIAELQKKVSITTFDDINEEMRPIMEEFYGLQDKYKKDKK